MASLWRIAIARLSPTSAAGARSSKAAAKLPAVVPPPAPPPAVQTPPPASAALEDVKAAVGKGATAVTEWSRQVLETASKATPSPSEWARAVADRAKKATAVDSKTTESWVRKTTTVAKEVSRAAIQQTTDKATAAARGLLWRAVGIVCLVAFAVSLGAAIPSEVRQYIERREVRRRHAADVIAHNHHPRPQRQSDAASDKGDRQERME